MSDEFTPSTEEIREYVMVGDPKPWESPSPEVDERERRRGAAFDRWLESVRADERKTWQIWKSEVERAITRHIDGPNMSVDGSAVIRDVLAALAVAPELMWFPDECADAQFVEQEAGKA